MPSRGTLARPILPVAAVSKGDAHAFNSPSPTRGDGGSHVEEDNHKVGDKQPNGGRTRRLTILVNMQKDELHEDDEGVPPPTRTGHDVDTEVQYECESGEEDAHEGEGDGNQGEGEEVEGENVVSDEEFGSSALLLEAERSVAEEETLHARAMQIVGIEAFEAELLLMRTDRTTCVSRSISKLAGRLLQPLFEGSPIFSRRLLCLTSRCP